MEVMRAIGLMSGTSMDGIDIALVETDGIRVVSRGPSMAIAYDPAFRRDLEAGLEDARTIDERSQRPGCLKDLEASLTSRHAKAVKTFLTENDIAREHVDVIGFHGQTVLHRPERALTVQIGDERPSCTRDRYRDRLRHARP